MPSSLRVAKILADLDTVGEDWSRSLPQRLVEACVAAVGVSGVGMVLMSDDGPVGAVAATNGPAGLVEELQFTLGVGPCVDAARSGHPVLIPDLARSGPSRWPSFAAGAMEAGVHALFAFPLQVGAIQLGVLDLYRDSPGDLSDAELRVALDFADAAVAVLLHLQSAAASDSPSGSHGTSPSVINGDASVLVQVVEDRAEVHQATGFVSAQLEVGLSEALVLLRARAYASDRPILDLARDVLAGRVTFTDDHPDGVEH